MSSGRRPRVVVTRAPHQALALADVLRELGAEPVLVPTIEIAELESYQALDDALARLHTFDWVAFTSANAVAVFQQRLEPMLNTAAIMKRPRVAAVGAATARALASTGWNVDVVPAQAVAESLAASLMPFVRSSDGQAARFLLVRAERARDVLPEALKAAGAEVVIAPAYRTVIPQRSVALVQELFGDAVRQPDAVTFTSGSSVRNFFDLLDAAQIALPQRVLRASIGPVTSAALRELGHVADVEAEEASVESLARAVLRALSVL